MKALSIDGSIAAGNNRISHHLPWNFALATTATICPLFKTTHAMTR